MQSILDKSIYQSLSQIRAVHLIPCGIKIMKNKKVSVKKGLRRNYMTEYIFARKRNSPRYEFTTEDIKIHQMHNIKSFERWREMWRWYLKTDLNRNISNNGLLCNNQSCLCQKRLDNFPSYQEEDCGNKKNVQYSYIHYVFRLFIRLYKIIQSIRFASSGIHFRFLSNIIKISFRVCILRLVLIVSLVIFVGLGRRRFLGGFIVAFFFSYFHNIFDII